MFFDEVLASNQAFIRGRQSRPVAEPDPRHLAVLSCYDPRIDDLIRSSLGLAMGEAILVRSAGAGIRATGDPLRSLALAIYMFDVRETIVLGHTSCRMSRFENLAFVEAFRARGVARDAFGSEDLREWVGAIRNPAAGVRESVSVIRAAQCLPRDLVVSGLLLDDASGAVTVIVRPDEAAGTPPHAEGDASPSVSRTEPAHPPPIPAMGSDDDALHRDVLALRVFMQRLESLPAWNNALKQLRADLDRERNPVSRLSMVQAFVARAGADARETLAAFDALHRAAAEGHPRLDRAALVDLFRAHR